MQLSLLSVTLIVFICVDGISSFSFASREEGKMTARDRIRSRFCKVMCPTIERPVCGTDGQTYANSCLLRKKICSRENTALGFLHAGECDECSADCTTDTDGPVCASNGRRYRNACIMNVDKCRTEQSITEVPCSAEEEDEEEIEKEEEEELKKEEIVKE